MVDRRIGAVPRWWRWAVILLCAGAFGWLGQGKVQSVLHEIDQRWLGEAAIDSLARLRGEDWGVAPKLIRQPDYRWLQRSGSPLLIGHALGDAITAQRNTLEAMRRSISRGWHHFEVDLWLDGSRIRCHHGPDAPAAYRPGDCDLQGVLQLLPEASWLILDVKTDFETTLERILQVAQTMRKLDRLVLQLYRPEHLAAFNRWQSTYPELPGPIITAYRAHRSVNHVAAHARRVGVTVVTMPIERARAYTKRDPGLELLVHPVHDCDALRLAAMLSARGVYQSGVFDCGS